MQWERPVTYGAMIAVLISLGLMVERSPWGLSRLVAAADWVITRGALVVAVYLFWRLVTACERRVRLDEGRARQET